jgi:hypothetical protein
MPYICPFENANETSVYKLNNHRHYDYEVSPNKSPHFYEYVNKIITDLNQDIYDEHAEYNIKALHTDPEYYGYDEDGYELNDYKHAFIDDAISELSYKECEKLISDIGLRKAVLMYEDCGFGEMTLTELKDIKGIRAFLYCIIYSCIEMHDDMEEVDEERYKIIFNIDSSDSEA